MKRARAIAASLVVVAGGVLASACDDDVSSHIYSGRLYEPSLECLDNVSAIDVVAGPEPMTPCAPICIIGLGDDATPSQVYVSTMCPPLPQYPYDLTGTDPRCPLALALYNQDTTCEDGGTVENPFDAAVLVDAAAPIDATLADAGTGSDATGVDATLPDAGTGADANSDDGG
jgi:hypothetical protein